MSYHVAIMRTRAGAPHPLSKEEVLAAAPAHPEVRCEVSSDGELTVVLRQADPESPVLWFQDGELWTKNPDEETLAFMVSFASTLGARVRGDELETYRTAQEAYLHPDDAKLVQATSGKLQSPWKTRLLLGLTLAAITFTIALLCGR